MCIDEADNELAALESIHLFVTVLHTYFNPVSELDMLYNFHKVRFFTLLTLYSITKIKIYNFIQ